MPYYVIFEDGDSPDNGTVHHANTPRQALDMMVNDEEFLRIGEFTYNVMIIGPKATKFDIDITRETKTRRTIKKVK